MLACLIELVCLQLAVQVWHAVAQVALVAQAHKTRSIYEKGMRQDMRQHASNQLILDPGLAGWLVWLAGLAGPG